MARLVVLAVFSAVLTGWTSAQAPGAPPYADNPKFQKEVAAAKAPRQLPSDRIDHWKKANKIAGGACLQCLEKIATLQFSDLAYKDAAASADLFTATATSPRDKGYGALLKGSALFHLGEANHKAEHLIAADAAFKSAVGYDPSLHIAEYMDGRALALLGRDDEAHATFLHFVASTPTSDRYHLRAQHFAENTALARAAMAPPFTVTTADGKRFTLDDMGGRVVLVDFWATWCGPCKEELPHIQKIAQEFAGQPFVLLSVSWDADEAKWKDFIDTHAMTWNQFRDADHSLSRAYNVDAIPHYFTIDADGVLQAEKMGSGADIEGKLRKLVARAREAQVVRPRSLTEPGAGGN